MSSQPTSPYKKFQSRNSSYCGYINLIKLTPHKPYKIYDLTETSHEQYGPGQMAYLEGTKKQKWRTQLPSKYLSQLCPDDLVVFKSDIAKGHNPFLVFREQMPDKSYRMDIVEHSPDMLQKFKNWDNVPELDQSGNSSLNVSNPECGSKFDEEASEQVAKKPKLQ